MDSEVETNGGDTQAVPRLTRFPSRKPACDRMMCDDILSLLAKLVIGDSVNVRLTVLY